jgi:hypothetical protein
VVSKSFPGDEIRYGMDRVCGTYEGELHTFWCGNLKAKDLLGDPDVSGRII